MSDDDGGGFKARCASSKASTNTVAKNTSQRGGLRSLLVGAEF